MNVNSSGSSRPWIHLSQPRLRGRIGLATVAALIAITATTMPTVEAASAPVARGDVARTNAGAFVQVRVVDNDFDPDGDSFSVIEVATPANGTTSIAGWYARQLHTRRRVLRRRDRSPTRSRDSTGLTSVGTLTVWVDTGVLSGAQSPDANTDYRYVYQGSSVGFTAAQLLANDSDPQGQALTVRGGVGTVQRRCADRVAGRRVRVHPRRCAPVWSAPTINSTISSPTPTVTSRRARS